jgi:hypothetical protein
MNYASHFERVTRYVEELRGQSEFTMTARCARLGRSDLRCLRSKALLRLVPRLVTKLGDGRACHAFSLIASVDSTSTTP